MRKLFILFLIAILGVPLLGGVAWYCVSFLPHLSELNTIEKQGRAIVSSAPPVTYRIVVAAESRHAIRGWGA